MGRRRWWVGAWTVLIAHVLGVVVLGLCQFTMTGIRGPGSCLQGSQVPSPWDRLSWWFQSGCKTPLTGVLDSFEIQRLNATLAAVAVLALLFGWSMWSMRPFRPVARIRLRTLMALIAIVPLELNGGAAVWNRWNRWDKDQHFADYYAKREAIEPYEIGPGDILLIEVMGGLPKRPITGERTVHSDGEVDLGHYGRVYVAGLTMVETKEKIVLHLRTYLSDEQLGLVEFSDSEPPVPVRRVRPSEAQCVFVDRTWLETNRDGPRWR
jgi:Polysaccharide biosynthesis/export protein